jgi:hypothetical protein
MDDCDCLPMPTRRAYSEVELVKKRAFDYNRPHSNSLQPLTSRYQMALAFAHRAIYRPFPCAHFSAAAPKVHWTKAGHRVIVLPSSDTALRARIGPSEATAMAIGDVVGHSSKLVVGQTLKAGEVALTLHWQGYHQTEGICHQLLAL